MKEITECRDLKSMSAHLLMSYNHSELLPDETTCSRQTDGGPMGVMAPLVTKAGVTYVHSFGRKKKTKTLTLYRREE